MLERLIWVPEVMIRLSRHYTTLLDFGPPDKQKSATMPFHLAHAVALTKTLNQATGLPGLMQPAMFDMSIHTAKTQDEADTIDTTAVWNETRRKFISHNSAVSEGTCGQASFFSPFFREYDVGYFTYVMYAHHLLLNYFNAFCSQLTDVTCVLGIARMLPTCTRPSLLEIP
jgi:Zn-dependent oligopeptidase